MTCALKANHVHGTFWPFEGKKTELCNLRPNKKSVKKFTDSVILKFKITVSVLQLQKMYYRFCITVMETVIQKL